MREKPLPAIGKGLLYYHAHRSASLIPLKKSPNGEPVLPRLFSSRAAAGTTGALPLIGLTAFVASGAGSGGGGATTAFSARALDLDLSSTLPLLDGGMDQLDCFGLYGVQRLHLAPKSRGDLVHLPFAFPGHVDGGLFRPDVTGLPLLIHRMDEGGFLFVGKLLLTGAGILDVRDHGRGILIRFHRGWRFDGPLFRAPAQEEEGTSHGQDTDTDDGKNHSGDTALFLGEHEISTFRFVDRVSWY